MAKTLDFPEWAPSLSALGTGVSQTITGCVPHADGYGPFGSLEEVLGTLPGPCRGYTFARKSDGSIAVFAGTSTRLYLLNNTDFTWTDVSKGGAAYSTLVATDNWQFRQFNDFVIAVQQNAPPQKFVMASATTFVDLLGTPPQARFIAIIGRIVVLSGLLSNPRRMQWCDLGAPEVWTAGVGVSDFQDMPDGGSCLSVGGGDAFGALFQDDMVRSIIYSPGASSIFTLVKIAIQETIFAAYSVIEAGSRIFYLSAQGFKVIENAQAPRPIGKDRVDDTFFADVDTSNLQLCIGATDPTATRVYWSYKSIAGQAGLFDKLLSYDWAIGKNGRWSLLLQSGEYIATFAKPGLTLEQLDAVAPTPLNVTGAANNGAGLIRLTLNALSNADFTIVGQNFIVVYGVVGTTEANATWRFTVSGALTIDLIGSAFVNAYVSGGHIGGSLDALPFSLDSISKAAIAQLAAFSSAHKLGFFSGPNMEAILETDEEDLEGRMVMVNGLRPLTDSPDALVSVGARLNAKATTAIFYTDESALDDNGFGGVIIETRYARGRLRIPAASVWSFARAMQVDASLAGEV